LLLPLFNSSSLSIAIMRPFVSFNGFLRFIVNHCVIIRFYHHIIEFMFWLCRYLLFSKVIWYILFVINISLLHINEYTALIMMFFVISFNSINPLLMAYVHIASILLIAIILINFALCKLSDFLLHFVNLFLQIFFIRDLLLWDIDVILLLFLLILLLIFLFFIPIFILRIFTFFLFTLIVVFDLFLVFIILFFIVIYLLWGILLIKRLFIVSAVESTLIGLSFPYFLFH